MRMILALLILMSFPYASLQAGTVEKIYPVRVLSWGPEVNGVRYFWGDGGTGATFWRTDGTTMGTWEVGPATSLEGLASAMVTDKTDVYVVVEPEQGPLHIYRSESGATFQPVPGLSGCPSIGAVGTHIYAICDLIGDDNYFEAYKITRSGNQLIFNHANVPFYASGRSDQQRRFYLVSTPTALFISTGRTIGEEEKLWRATPDGQLSLVCAEDEDPHCPGDIYKSPRAGSGRLWWALDYNGGLAANGRLVRDHEGEYPLTPWVHSSHYAWGLNGGLFFNNLEGYYDGSFHYSPWFSDGTSTGTMPLGNIEPVPYTVSVIALMNDQLFFSLQKPQYKHTYGELWVTDGTTGGTRLVSSNWPAKKGGSRQNHYPDELSDSSGRVYYSCSSVPDNIEVLCRTDGTEQGTERVVFGNSTNPQTLSKLNGLILLGMRDYSGVPGIDPTYYLGGVNTNDSVPNQDLSLSVIGNGLVSFDVGDIECDVDCNNNFHSDTLITLTAVPDPGETFLGWEGDIYGLDSDGMECYWYCDTTTTTLKVSMFVDRKITARFSPNTYTVTPAPSSFGSITPDTPQVVDSGETTTFSISPDFGFEARSVTGCGGTLDGSTYTTGPVNADCTVSAEFLPPDTTCTAGNAILGPVIYSDGDLLAELAEGKLITDGNVLLESGASVIYEATTSIELNQGFRAMNGSRLSAQTKLVVCE